MILEARVPTPAAVAYEAGQDLEPSAFAPVTRDGIQIGTVQEARVSADELAFELKIWIDEALVS